MSDEGSIKEYESLNSTILALAAQKANLSYHEIFIIRAWLAEQLIAQEYAKLGQGGHTNTQVPLDQVFIDLPVKAADNYHFNSEKRVLFLKNLLMSKPLVLKNAFRHHANITLISDDSSEDCNVENETLNLYLDYENPTSEGWAALLLIGGPGQGKSTLGQLACQLHRAALLHPYLDELNQKQKEIVVSLLNQSNLNNSNKTAKNILFPIQISLPDFAEWAASNINNRKASVPIILQFLTELPSAKALGLEALKLFELICILPSLLVLDGFDEVGATQDRERIVFAARELLTALSERSASSQILATTRPQGYANELAEVGIKLKKVILAPLLKAEALEYADKLIKAKISGADQQDKAFRQIKEAAQEPATERLLTTPLQVTILTALVQQLGRAPRERWNLFSRYFAYTYDREIERNTYASALLAQHRSHIERIHARVGLLLQVEAESDGGASARMSQERLEHVISEVLAEDEVANDQQKQLIRDIAAAAENRLVFLVEPEPGKFGFEIRSLQEFMAAWALTSGRDTEIEARLYQVSKSPMFRNVALFIASRLFSEGSPLRDILSQKICKNLDEDIKDELSRLAHAGAMLALETLEEGAALSQPKRARALMERALGLLELPPSYEHVRLARVANEDTFTLIKTAIEKKLNFSYHNKEYNSSTHSAWVCLIDATNRDELWAIELGNRHWDNFASSELILSLNVSNVALGNWICKKIEEYSDKIPPDIFIDSSIQTNEHNIATSWVAWLIQTFSSLDDLNRRHVHAITLIIAKHQCPRLEQPKYNSPQSKIWLAWIAIANFEKNPNVEHLIEALDKLSETSDIEYWRKCEWSFSWPIVACINSVNNTLELQDVIYTLKIGNLGNEKLWMNAQEKWIRTNKSFDWRFILENQNNSAIWNVQSIENAPPLYAFSFWMIINQLPVFASRSNQVYMSTIIEKAGDLLRTSKSNYIQEILAAICIGAWQQLTYVKQKDFDESELKKWIKYSPKSAVLLVKKPKRMPIKKWTELLNDFNHINSRPTFASTQFVFKALKQLPTNIVLLSLAAYSIRRFSEHFGSHGNFLKKYIFDLIDEIEISKDYFLNPISVANYSILKIFSASYPSSEDDYYLSNILATQDKDIIFKALIAIRTGRMSRNRADSILIRLYFSSHKLCAISAHEAMKAIRDVLQKRTSELDLQVNWNKLALPLPYPKPPLQPKIINNIPALPIRINSLKLEDIGGIKQLSFEFKPPLENVGQWIVIIGPNGSGKTTLLRSLTLALRSVKHPSIWPKGAFSNSWQRIPTEDEKNNLSSSILVTLGDGVEHQTLIRPSSSINITQLPEQDRPRLFPIFAYGCRRGSALGGSARQVNLNDDDGPEIATLFDEGADLIQAETWLVSLEGDIQKNSTSRIIYESVISALKKLMNLDTIEISHQQIWASEVGKAKVPFRLLSDGYLTNAGWFLDLIARWLKLAEENNFIINESFLLSMTGLVLIDEIDLHLHPQWQIEIISRTKQLLPNMSFVVTTHNPLTLVGAKAEEIWVLSREGNNIKATSCMETPMFMTGGQIYRQYFGIRDIYPTDIGRLLHRFSYLSGYALRDDNEEAELEKIKDQLFDANIDPGWEIVPRVQLI